MTDDFTHELLFNQWEEDDWEEDDWDRGCVLGDECLHHDPEHTPDECFDLEYIEEFYREADRETSEYKLGVNECNARWTHVIKELHGEFGVYNEHIRFALSELRKRMNALL